MRRLTLVVPVFPKLSETFIVNKFLGLVTSGYDVFIVTQRLDMQAWSQFDQLAQRPELQKRIYAGSIAPRALTSMARRWIFPVTAATYRRNGFKNVISDTIRHSNLLAAAPDLLHFEFGSLAVNRAHIGRTAGCKVVVSFRGYDLNFVGLDNPGYYNDVWAHADAVHCLGEDLWKRALRRGCPSDKPHALIPPSIDTEYFKPGTHRSEDTAGTRARPLRLLSVGRIEWKKGYEYALQAVRMLMDRGLSVEYRIVGAGEYLEAVTFCRHQLGLDAAVSLAGPARPAQVREHLEWADVFLHAAVSEGFCNAVLEAQAMHVPVVTSDADGLAENVENGATGFVVPRRDPRGLAEGVAALAGDGPLRARMGRAGRERVTERFRLDRQIESFARFYQQVLH